MGDEEGLVTATADSDVNANVDQQQQDGVDGYATDGGQELYYTTDPSGVVSGQQFAQDVAPQGAPQWVNTRQSTSNNLDS